MFSSPIGPCDDNFSPDEAGGTMEICDYTLEAIIINIGHEVWICCVNSGFYSSEILNNHLIFQVGEKWKTKWQLHTYNDSEK